MSKTRQLRSGPHGGRSLTTPMLFASLPETMRAQLRASARPQTFSDGQLIQSLGDSPDGFWLIDEGRVSVGRIAPDGDFRAVAMLGPGDSYGEFAMLAGRARIVDAIARGPAVLRAIRRSTFDRVLDDHPGALRALLGALASQLQDSIVQLAAVGRISATVRMARLLANLARGGSGTRRLAMTQQELADLLGFTRATANAALCKLEAEGLIQRGYGTIEVPDSAKLARFGRD